MRLTGVSSCNGVPPWTDEICLPVPPRSFCLGSLALRAAARPGFRRVRPGDPQWPNAAAWNKLKAEVGGNLLESSPLSGALQNLRNPLYIGDQPGGTQVSGWVDAWGASPEHVCRGSSKCR